MMTNAFSEDTLVERSLLDILSDILGASFRHINAFSPAGDAELARESQGEVLLKAELVTALQRLNPLAPENVVLEAFHAISTPPLETSASVINRNIASLLVAGYKTTFQSIDGKTEDIVVRYFDFDNPTNNLFLCVSQMWITGELHTRRPDVILYVNGIPLILFELKASHVKLVNAYSDNIRDYKDTIPKLFWYNLGIILSNGIESKFGSFTAPYEFFNEWKKAESEHEQTSTSLRTIVSGICNPNRLLDIFENFVLFESSELGYKKILPRYFQFHGVNGAFQRVLDRRSLKGRLGVFWHTQGSGKSYSMVFLSQKVFRKVPGNFTFVIVTDRTDLDRQAYKNFASVGAVYESEVHADSIVHLKELLQGDHRQIFTIINKFQDIHGPISLREDIIIMTDEAHRSQYDLFAMNMRLALPNAAFIGFTGTPLMSEGEEKTRETFGDYISEYNFGDSVKDGATVPLFYENRIPQLNNDNVEIEKELNQIMDYYDLNDQDEERLERSFSTFYHLVTREERLNIIAKDIVEHFLARSDKGKALVVSIDKRTAIRTFTKVHSYLEDHRHALEVELNRTHDDFAKKRLQKTLDLVASIDLAVMVSQSQNEIADLAKYGIDIRPIRNRIQNEDLESKFKDPNDSLRIVFVCAMWMTGFDVPNLATLYIDKPMKNHTLMQAIARANRVYPDKLNGLIVDYIGVFRNIEKALAIYATGRGKEPLIQDKEALYKSFVQKRLDIWEALRSFGIELQSILDSSPEEKLLAIEATVNSLLSMGKKISGFIEEATVWTKTYKSLLPDPRLHSYQNEIYALKSIISRIKSISEGDVDLSAVKKDLEELLDRSIKASEFKIPAYVKLKDLSQIDAEKLKTIFQSNSNKIVQMEELKAELKDKLEELVKINRSRETFVDRLNKAIEEYNKGVMSVDDLLDQLILIARDLTAEESRAFSERLTEDELAIFDIIRKESLGEAEVTQVKSASKELLLTLRERLVPGWREFDPLRSGVKIAINNVIYPKLPEKVYSENDCHRLSGEVYRFVFERFPDASFMLAV